MNEWDDVLIVMEIMQQQGLCQEKSTYRSCLQSCFKHANGSSASEILEAMEKAMVQPDPVDISLVVATMCKNEHTEDGWWQKALTLLKSSATTIATPQNVVPVEAYDTVLSCLVSKPNHWKVAVRLLYLMEKGSVADEQPTGKQIASGIEDGQMGDQDVGHHPAPILSTYRLVIETCVAANEPEQAFQVLKAMKKRNLKVSHGTSICARSSLLRRIVYLVCKSCRPRQQKFSTFLAYTQTQTHTYTQSCIVADAVHV